MIVKLLAIISLVIDLAFILLVVAWPRSEARIRLLMFLLFLPFGALAVFVLLGGVQ
jgi:hypothetical protein